MSGVSKFAYRHRLGQALPGRHVPLPRPVRAAGARRPATRVESVDTSSMWDGFRTSADAPDFLTSKASRQAVAALQADLLARLNAVDAVLQSNRTDADLEDAECSLTGAVPAFDGPGRWLLTRTEFRAIHEEQASIR
jgi:hypothetical protein